MAVDVGILDQVTQQFLTALKQDAHLIEISAKHLFYYLVIIQLSLSALWMVLMGESLSGFVGKSVQLVFSFGFFYALIDLGGTWVPDLLNGFIQLGQQGGVHSLDPSSIVDQGVSISGAILKGFFGWGLLGHPFVSLIGAIVCIAILVIYGLMAAELAIVLVKSYIIVATGGLFFALGASDYTRDMTKNYFKATIGLGLNLMTLYLLLGVGQHIGEQWAAMTAQAAAQHALMPMLVILAAVIVYYMILKNVPAFVAGLSGVGGFRNYGDTAVAMAINAGTTGTAVLSRAAAGVGHGAQSVAQVGQAGMHAWSSVGAHVSEHGGGLGSVVRGVRDVALHAVSAAGNTVKDMAMCQNEHLTMGQKFNTHLGNSVRPNKRESL